MGCHYKWHQEARWAPHSHRHLSPPNQDVSFECDVQNIVFCRKSDHGISDTGKHRDAADDSRCSVVWAWTLRSEPCHRAGRLCPRWPSASSVSSETASKLGRWGWSTVLEREETRGSVPCDGWNCVLLDLKSLQLGVAVANMLMKRALLAGAAGAAGTPVPEARLRVHLLKMTFCLLLILKLSSPFL